MAIGGVARFVIRTVCSLIGAIVPFFMMSSYMYPGLPSMSSSLSSSSIGSPELVQSLFGAQIPSSLTGPLSSLGPITHLFPFVAAGGGGLIVWMIVQQVLGRVESLSYSSSIPRSNHADMMKNFGINMPSFSTQPNTNTPVPKLPDDITKVQFTILKSFQQGYKKSKDMEKQLFMDKKEIEKEISILKTNSYVTKDNKLTSKAVELLSS